MDDKFVSRRQMLKASAAAVVAGLARPVSAIDYTTPVPEASGLTAYQKDGSIQVRFDNLPIAAYRAQPSLKYPYFCPLNGPRSGLSLVSESALPYPHHRGLWLGCDPLNGGNYWADNRLDSGQIRSLDLRLEAKTPTSIQFTERCRWTRRGAASNEMPEPRMSANQDS